MILRIRYKISLYLLILLAFQACKEEDVDEFPPLLSVTSPRVNSSHQALSSVQIVGEISDDQNISSVRISLTRSSDKATVLKTIGLSPNVKNYQLNVKYEFTDSTMEAGEYYFTVTASDGENSNQFFLPIRFQPVERRSLGIIAQCGDNVANFYWVDQLNNRRLVHSNSGVVTHSKFDNYSQQLYYTNESTKQLRSYNVKEGLMEWNHSVIVGSGRQAFNDLKLYEGAPSITVGNGNIKGFRRNGSQDIASVANLAHIPKQHLRTSDVLYVAEEPFSAGETRFGVYSAFTGLFLQSITFPTAVVGIFQAADGAWIFGNENGEGILRVYDLDANTSRTVRTFPNDSLKKVVQVSANDFLLLTQDQILKYRINTGTFTPYLSTSTAKAIVFDSFTLEVLISEGANIQRYDYVQGNLLGQMQMPEEVQEIMIRNNY